MALREGVATRVRCFMAVVVQHLSSALLCPARCDAPILCLSAAHNSRAWRVRGYQRWCCCLCAARGLAHGSGGERRTPRRARVRGVGEGWSCVAEGEGAQVGRTPGQGEGARPKQSGAGSRELRAKQSGSVSEGS